MQRSTKIIRKVRCIQMGNPSAVGRTDWDSGVWTCIGLVVDTSMVVAATAASGLHPFEGEPVAGTRTSFSRSILMIVCYGQERLLNRSQQQLTCLELRAKALDAFRDIA